VPALRKPHRVAFLVPELVVEGGDAPNAAEAGLLLWMACIEVCQRHPGLAVFDAESTPLVSQDGHFTPDHAWPGVTPGDSFYGPTRRDELVWLELALPRPGPVRLHAVARDGKHDSFEVAGRNAGDQIHQAIERWLAARGLGALPRRFEAVEAGDVLAAVRVLAPVLGEQARAHFPVESFGGAHFAEAAAADRTELGGESGPGPAEAGEAADAVRPVLPGRRIARALAGRLTPVLRVPALRLIALALREDLGDLILAADPEQPQALFARFRAALPLRGDDALLRRILASAPCWALPYGELIDDGGGDPAGADAAEPGGDRAPPTWLETSAGAGIAALCQPGQLAVIQTAAARLAEDGRIDDGLRVLERAVALYPDSADAHVALLRLHRRAGRLGAWLAQAQASAARHGCPLDPGLPWYGDQIQIDLLLADALLHTGRIDEAIALRAGLLAGRDASWPRHTRILASWRSDPRLLARSHAREGWLRGDPGAALEGYGRTRPDEAVDVAFLLDALVATGRDGEVALAWSQFGLGHELTEPVARLAAARCLLAAGDWRRGIEELWRVALTEPGRDIQAQVARAGLLLTCAPLDVLDAALGERVATGALTLARRMARDVADFVPGAAKSSIVLRALGKPVAVEFDPAWLAGFPADTRSRRAIDALFAEPTTRGSAPAIAAPRGSAPAIAAPASDPDLLARRDRLVHHWLPVVFTEVAEDDAAGLAQAAAYVAGSALGRYLAATTAAPSPLAGGYRVVAAEALALVWRHRGALTDRDARALLGVLEPLLRRVDRWLGSLWLGVIERSCAIDERANGDVAGFAREHPTVAARILGPEETAVLGASVARLYRERPDGWASAVAAQAGRLASHTGHAGTDEWADAVACQLAAREIESDDAIDVLHAACYLAEGKTAAPCVHAARVLLAAGRAPAALGVLCAGLGAGDAPWRAAQVAALAGPWAAAHVELPLDRERAAAQLFEALEAGEPVRAEKLGRLAVALDPDSAEAQRNLGLALAQQGKLPEALHHLALGVPEQATEILCGVLDQSGRLAEASAVRAYASRWLGSAPSTGATGDAAAGAPRPPVFELLEAGDAAAAAAQLADPSWRVRRAALAAIRARSPADDDVAVPPRARAAAEAVLADTAGLAEHDAVIARDLALAIREQAYFARDPLPQLGDRMARDAFHRELVARGGALDLAPGLAPDLAPGLAPGLASGAAPGAPAPAARFADRNAVPDGQLSRVSDYVALIRDLAVLTPREALAEFDLDDAGYLEVATAWARAIAGDPTLAAAIAAGLAKR
jgi:tetratricopeptide (TPR) repeat protein